MYILIYCNLLFILLVHSICYTFYKTSQHSTKAVTIVKMFIGIKKRKQCKFKFFLQFHINYLENVLIFLFFTKFIIFERVNSEDKYNFPSESTVCVFFYLFIFLFYFFFLFTHPCNN